MRYLIDTHTFLWFVSEPNRLPNVALSIIRDQQNDLFVSMASLWEIGIKTALGKLVLADPLDVIVESERQNDDINVIPIELSHVLSMMTLPFHHQDPFDRLLAGQCLAENLTIISVDPVFDLYGVARIWQHSNSTAV